VIIYLFDKPLHFAAAWIASMVGLRSGGPVRSSWVIAVTFEDPTGVYPSPNSSAPTGFTLLAGSSNQVIAVPSSMLAIAAYQFTLNAPSSTGAKVNFIAMQAGIG
jgi:hypothetical protein